MEVEILDLDDLGNGITKINHKVCFIKKCLPGELVDIKIIKDNKKYSMGEIIDIKKESNLRVNPVCKYYDKCGGCNFLHAKESLEKEFKIEKAKKFFSRCDKFYETNSYNYRDKVKLHARNGNLGFYESKTNDLVSIDYCYLSNQNINKVIAILNKHKDTSFNGVVTIRENKSSEIMLVIEGDYKYLNKLKNNSLITNLIYNDKVIKGNDYFIEEIDNYKFKVSYNSFFQVNRLGLERIYQVLSNFLKDKDINKSLDLYSGTSVLGIHLAKYSKEVISVEVNTSATNDAIINLELNNINNLKIINDKVENVIDEFKDIDLIVIDPARSGLDKKTISYLNKIKSKYLIYIACGVDALRRDLKELENNYNLENIYLVDMFPRTNNIETIAILSLKENGEKESYEER